MRFHLDGAFADGDGAVGRNRDHARQQSAVVPAHRDYARRAVFHGGNQAVGGAEVYAKNPCHFFQC
jgi:hypothetical protein